MLKWLSLGLKPDLTDYKAYWLKIHSQVLTGITRLTSHHGKLLMGFIIIVQVFVGVLSQIRPTDSPWKLESSKLFTLQPSRMTSKSQVRTDPFILKKLILSIKLYSISVTCPVWSLLTCDGAYFPPHAFSLVRDFWWWRPYANCWHNISPFFCCLAKWRDWSLGHWHASLEMGQTNLNW